MSPTASIDLRIVGHGHTESTAAAVLPRTIPGDPTTSLGVYSEPATS